MDPDAYAPNAAAKVRLGSKPAIRAGHFRAAGPSMDPDAYAPNAAAKVRLGSKPAIPAETQRQTSCRPPLWKPPAEAADTHYAQVRRQQPRGPAAGLIGCEPTNHFRPPNRRQQA